MHADALAITVGDAAPNGWQSPADRSSHHGRAGTPPLPPSAVSAFWPPPSRQLDRDNWIATIGPSALAFGHRFSNALGRDQHRSRRSARAANTVVGPDRNAAFAKQLNQARTPPSDTPKRLRQCSIQPPLFEQLPTPENSIQNSPRHRGRGSADLARSLPAARASGRSWTHASGIRPDFGL